MLMKLPFHIVVAQSVRMPNPRRLRVCKIDCIADVCHSVNKVRQLARRAMRAILSAFPKANLWVSGFGRLCGIRLPEVSGFSLRELHFCN